MPAVQLRVHTAFGEVEIERSVRPLDAATIDRSVRELRRLVRDFAYRDPGATRAILTVHSWLRGLDGLDASSYRQADPLDTGSPRAAEMGDAVLTAASSGAIVARRRDVRSVSIPLEVSSETVLGPDSNHDSAPPSQSWIGLLLLDQDGVPVPNRRYRISKPDGTTVDGMLDSQGSAIIQGLTPGSCQIWCPYVDPHPETTYPVQPGDHISGIAERFGFDDYTAVWSDPGNADLQRQRSDPHVLQPDDHVTVPEVKAQPGASRPTGARHRFQIKRTPLKLRLTLLGLDGKPVPNAQVTVAGVALTTDGNGLAEASVDKSAAATTFDHAQGAALALSLGGLNPSDDTSHAGYKARLYNMGFLWDLTADDDDDEMVIALQDFQAQYAMTVTGQLDDATRTQLLKLHGC